MAGRHSTGAAAGAISQLVVHDQQQRHAFQQRLQQAWITAGIRSGQIAPSFTPQGQFQGFGPGSGPTQLSTMAGLGQESLDAGLASGEVTMTHTIKTPQGTITVKRGGTKPGGAKTTDPTLTAQRAQATQTSAAREQLTQDQTAQGRQNPFMRMMAPAHGVAENRVRVIGPKGERGTVPASQIAQAQAAGFTVQP